MAALLSAGLYIHLPWCLQKCPYCDFNSHALKQPLAEGRYIDALKRDMVFEAERWQDRVFTSIFFGGGTPSLFSAVAVDQILQVAAHIFSLDSNIEITLEANPSAAEAMNFKGYMNAGVSRLSLGVQSLDDSLLRILGRTHSADEAQKAFLMARESGFANINIDLMFGLPDQTVPQALEDLHQVMQLEPEHISWYQLTLEPNTEFAHSPPQLPSHDDCFNMQQHGIEKLHSAGFSRYEVSAFAKIGQQCQHNLTYWRFGDYLGVGAGAHGKYTRQGITRFARVRHPKDYLRTAGTIEVLRQQGHIDHEQRLFEFLLNRLRLTEPFLLLEMTQLTGVMSENFLCQLSKPIQQGLLEINHGYCRTTNKGLNYIDDILLSVLPETKY